MSITTKLHNKIFGIPYVLFIFLHFISIIYLSKIEIINYIGALSAVMIVGASIIFVFLNSSNLKPNITWKLMILFLFLNTIWLIMDFTPKGIYLWGQQTALLIYITNISITTINPKTLNKINKFFANLYLIIMITNVIFLVFGPDIIFLKYFSGTILKIFFALSFFALIYFKKNFIIIILSFTIFIAIGERTSAITLIFIYLMYYFLKLLKKKKNIFYLFYWVCIFLFISLPRLYVWLSTQSFASELNNLSFSLFGERFFSGRNFIWSYAFNALEGHAVFGLGISNNVVNDLTYQSVHNLYIFLMLQGGYFLIGVFALFMFSIWKQFYNYLDNSKIRLSAAFFLGILLYINFELLLLVNNFVVSMYLWLIIGVGLMIINYQSLNIEKNNLA